MRSRPNYLLLVLRGLLLLLLLELVEQSLERLLAGFGLKLLDQFDRRVDVDHLENEQLEDFDAVFADRVQNLVVYSLHLSQLVLLIALVVFDPLDNLNQILHELEKQCQRVILVQKCQKRYRNYIELLLHAPLQEILQQVHNTCQHLVLVQQVLHRMRRLQLFVRIDQLGHLLAALAEHDAFEHALDHGRQLVQMFLLNQLCGL